ncbi:ABC transporter substrate-binding protein [Streptomyces termitum]|uniref:ABC transporter substrate-binding protein n=1 Tax=Streptomyces termitum TaxID=67368 RepID=UPI0033BEB501
MSQRTPAGLRRRSFLRYTGAVGTAAVLTGTLAACGGPTSTGSASGAGGGTSSIEAGISYALSTGFDPMTASGATPVAANTHVFEGLADLDPATLVARPALATALPEKVNATTYRATLRSGATFHDGSPVTSEDVVYSFERILDPKNASLMAQFLPFLDSVKAVDASTVEFRLKYAFDLFPSRVTVAKIVPKKLVEADPKGFDAKPVGSGPYRLVSATKEDKIVFEAYDKYNGRNKAKVKNMTWRLMSDPAARVSALESGRVQAIEDVPYIDAKRLSQKATVDSVQSFGQLFMMFNTRQKPFDDKRVRQAFHYALNTPKIIETAMMGNGSAAQGYLQTTHPDFHKASTVYTYDPAKARKLLAEAGVNDLSIELLTTDTGWVKDIAPLVKESLDAVGVKTTLSIGQSSAQYGKVDEGKFQVLVAPGDPSVFGNDVDLLMRWFYDGTWPTKRYRWDGTAPDKQLRALLDRAARSSDAAERTKLWNQAMDLISDEVPIYPILHRKLPTAWNDKALPGFSPLPTTGMSFLNVGRS